MSCLHRDPPLKVLDNLLPPPPAACRRCRHRRQPAGLQETPSLLALLAPPAAQPPALLCMPPGCSLCLCLRLLEGHKQPLYCGAFNHFNPKLLGDLFATVGGNRVGAQPLWAAGWRRAGTDHPAAHQQQARHLSVPCPRFPALTHAALGPSRPPYTAADLAASCSRCRCT